MYFEFQLKIKVCMQLEFFFNPLKEKREKENLLEKWHTRGFFGTF